MGKALADLDLLTRVADHKKIFFRARWSKYDEARPGSLRLLPRTEKYEALRRDYQGMRPMLFGKIPPFAIASVRTRGVICQDRPHLSLHQPHMLSAPPLYHRQIVFLFIGATFFYLPPVGEKSALC